ncbi:hypothetical protein [Thioalkalivibrio sp. AKL12]|uniref:hypothetical protein n=1 Tax=Thioalkalivibrio sp. AKL12 TaxID=1158159 RepID=UPI0003686A3E|nr:hypothetical protein [Thioalkalivibrio sp. AKL12]
MRRDRGAAHRRAWSALGGLVSLATLGFAAPALADVATDDLQVNAGLVAGLTLTCDKPLTFGVLRMQSLDLGVTATQWRLTPNLPEQLPSFNQTAGAFGTATSVLPGPGQGECAVVGSVAPDDTTIGISFASSSVTLTGAEVLDLSAATPPEPGLTVDRFRTNPSLPTIVDGETRFAIGADLNIPNNLVTENFGGYTTTVTVTVEENLP